MYYLNGLKEEHHTKPNNYDKVLNKALANHDINKKIEDIITKINKLDNIKLNNLLKVICEYLDE